MNSQRPHATDRHRLADPEQFIVWASRHYLWSAIRSTPAPDFVFEAFENAGIDVLYYSLDRVLVCLLAAPTREIVVHDVRCPCLALHEEALLTGLRRLQHGDDVGFVAALSAVMLQSAVKVSGPAMKLLAEGMRQMKVEHSATTGEYGEGPDDAAWRQHGKCQDRTIN
ncbi:MAG: hypothetical protein WD795_14090 [Woeseia sp.]